MEKKRTIRVAEITISVQWEIQDLHCKLDPVYQSFFGKGRSDIVLRIRRVPHNLPLERKVFDCAPVWTLYRGDGKWIIKLFHDERYPYAERVMVLHPSLCHGELYIKEPPNGSPFVVEPFHGPTAELLMVQYLAQGKGLLLHSCGIELEGKGILFMGHSGAGKSTMARLWNDGKNGSILSDDRIILRKKDGVHWIYGTPWHGEEQYASPQGYPLGQIYFIKHAGRNIVRETSEVEATSRLVAYSFPPLWDKEGMEFTLTLLRDLSKTVPCQELEFLPDERVIHLVRSMN